MKSFKEYIETSSISNTNKLVLALLYETGVRLRELVNIEIKNISCKMIINHNVSLRQKVSNISFYRDNLISFNHQKFIHHTLF